MDQGRVADGGGLAGNRSAFGGIAERRGFPEGKSVGGSNGFGLEGGGENNKNSHEHCGGEKPRESRYPQHFLIVYCPLLRYSFLPLRIGGEESMGLGANVRTLALSNLPLLKAYTTNL